MTLVEKSLDAVSVTGPGSVLSFDKPRSPLSMQVSVTGAPSSAVVALQTSLDGTTWFDASGVSGGTPTNMCLTGMLALHARANLVELTGGSSPTVTAIIAAGD